MLFRKIFKFSYIFISIVIHRIVSLLFKKSACKLKSYTFESMIDNEIPEFVLNGNI